MNTQQRNDLNRIIKAMYANEVAGGLSQVPTILELITLSKSYAKLQEHACNGALTHRQMVRESKIECDIIDRALTLGMDARFQGDPRGFCVWLTKEVEVAEVDDEDRPLPVTYKTVDVVGIA